MSTVPECLAEVIGLSRTQDNCVDINYDASYSQSLSGLYIDELQGMSLRLINATDNSTTLWEKMDRSRENAISTFRVDLMQEVLKYKEPIRDRFSGDIGYKQFKPLVSSTHDYYGLRLYSDVRGGVFVLRSITVMLNSTETFDVEIYDDYDLVYTISVTSQANRPTTTDVTPIELPLDRNYYFIYNPVGQPYANKLTCGCGNYRWCFCVETPCYKPSRDKWTEWAMVGGVSGDVLSDRENWPCNSNANGLSLHGNFSCSVTICNEDSDFINNEIDVAMAYAVLYKTGEFLTNYIMDTGEVSRYTLLGTEALNENRIYYNKRYAVMIDFIARSIDDDRDDCMRCKSPMGLGKRSHFI